MPTLRSPAGAGRPTGARARSAGVTPLPNSAPCRCFEALPETLRETATGEALQAIVAFDLGELAEIDPPRGFGRD
jgi:hypothetical protein